MKDKLPIDVPTGVAIPTLILSVALSPEDVRSITDYTDAVIRNTTKRLAPQLRDAARYRWLRDVDDDPYNLKSMWYAASPYDRTSGGGADAVDAAIDAAMKEKPNETK